MKSPERIPIHELQAELQSAKKLVLIDVREKREVAESGRIPGALHIPMGQIQKRMEDYEEDQPIVFYCGGGGRASRAADAFFNAGFKNVRFCGLRDWKKLGLPTAP